MAQEKEDEERGKNEEARQIREKDERILELESMLEEEGRKREKEKESIMGYQTELNQNDELINKQKNTLHQK